MLKKYLAECIGTMVLVLMGCGCAVMNGGAVSVAAVLTIAFAFGLSVVAMAYTIGSISGCHINPAITLGVWLSGKMPAGQALLYMVSQVTGAILGSLVLSILVKGLDLTGTGANGYVEGYGWVAFVAEFIFTFIFVLVVLGTTSATGHIASFAGLAIGLTLVLVHIVCIPITGTSVNPARSIGPALFEGGVALSQLWLFIVAPLLGGALAALVWKILAVKEVILEEVIIKED
ncbi:MAG: MIP family channel protein [Tannerellaceae bacterium]|nr:MIP family channel protein [Tannerellaceae bacterium]